MERRHFLHAALAAPLFALDPKSLKLGISIDEIADDPQVVVRFMKEFGLRYAEIRNVWGKYNTSLPLEKLSELRQIFDEHGIQTSVLATGFFKIALPPETPAGQAILDQQWKLLDGAMDRAKIMGTKRIRTFAFTYDNDAKPDPAVYPRIYELVKESARRAKARGFQLALENVNHSYVWSSTEAAALLKAVPDDALGLTWDPNNAGQTGEKVFPEGYRRLDPARIHNVHLRDFRTNSAGVVEWCAVGEGVMDNLGQIRALRKAGYDQAFTLETHYKSPQGKEHASRTSMTGLLKVVERV
ncbi:MAG: sugar phosphate isomerase/epimerase [Bryobacteraceae bacterium]|nr:sugar phosphate isomerase/epimerase [Bryobacteraceae bacterium]